MFKDSALIKYWWNLRSALHWILNRVATQRQSENAPNLKKKQILNSFLNEHIPLTCLKNLNLITIYDPFEYKAYDEF